MSSQLSSFESGSLNIVLLLKLSSALDTINNSILLNCLQSCIDKICLALSWFRFYFSERFHLSPINANPIPPQSHMVSPEAGCSVSSSSSSTCSLDTSHITSLGCHHRLQFHIYTNDSHPCNSTKTKTSSH